MNKSINDIESRSSMKHRRENDDDDGATWSISSYGDLTHNDGLIFESRSNLFILIIKNSFK